jgi:GT2 family glycosyltransferase
VETEPEPQLDLTVIIPCRNVASTLSEQLDALIEQEWSGSWEVIVVDNGSTDGTADIALSYAEHGLPLRVVSAPYGSGVAFARNVGIGAARSRSIAICDGDDVVQPGWVAAMGDALREYPLVGGLVDPSLVNENWLATTRPLGVPGSLPRFGGWSFVSGGNCGMWRSVWNQVGGYDESFRGLEDIEFTLRAKVSGFEPTLVPQAVIGYRYREGLRPLWRQGFLYGRGRRELARRARTVGLPTASSIAGLKSWIWLLVHLPNLRSRRGRYSWLWVLANRVGAARALLDRRPPAPIGEPRVQATHSRRPMPSSGRFHGVLITFRRLDELTDSLHALFTQTVQLDSLTVVDNDADERVRQVTHQSANCAHKVHYMATSSNIGPAGGIHAGVSHVLAEAADGDWIVLLDDDDPPPRADTLASLRLSLDDLVSRDPSCAGVGLWGASLKRRTGRLRAAGGRTPELVDYLPGGSCPHYSVAALRVVQLPDPELFFGFDDLDLGLRLRDAGWRVYSSGLAREHSLRHMVEGRRASTTIKPPTWRRYYSLRNLVLVLRAHGETRGALVMSLVSGLLKPVFNAPRHPFVAVANLRLNSRALRDGWSGRAGRTIDPALASQAASSVEGTE